MRFIKGLFKFIWTLIKIAVILVGVTVIAFLLYQKIEEKKDRSAATRIETTKEVVETQKKTTPASEKNTEKAENTAASAAASQDTQSDTAPTQAENESTSVTAAQATSQPVLSPTEDEQGTVAEEASEGIRPEVKQALDDYEEFFDDYIDFMKKYAKNPTDPLLLVDYAKFLAKYATTMESFEKFEETEELNKEEDKYYLEVSARITKKLIDAETELGMQFG